MAITIGQGDSPFGNAEMFYVGLHGSIIIVTVTAAASAVRKWIRDVLYWNYLDRSQLVVGMGVQWTPVGEDPPADTLQLCVGHRCLIYQLAHTDYVPMLLRRFLMNPDHIFVGFWNHSDARKLLNCRFQLTMWSEPLDLRHFVATSDGESLNRASVEEIVEQWLGLVGVRMDREISMSHWGEMFLSHNQILQACLDAHCAFLIGESLGPWEI